MSRKGSPEPGSSKSPDSDQPVAISKPSRRDERYAKSDFVVQWDPQEGLMPQILSITSSPRKETRKKKNNILIIGEESLFLDAKCDTEMNGTALRSDWIQISNAEFRIDFEFSSSGRLESRMCFVSGGRRSRLL